MTTQEGTAYFQGYGNVDADERLRELEQRATALETDLTWVKKAVQAVQAEMDLLRSFPIVRRIVFTSVGLTLAAVITAGLALVVKS